MSDQTRRAEDWPVVELERLGSSQIMWVAYTKEAAPGNARKVYAPPVDVAKLAAEQLCRWARESTDASLCSWFYQAAERFEQEGVAGA